MIKLLYHLPRGLAIYIHIVIQPLSRAKRQCNSRAKKKQAHVTDVSSNKSRHSPRAATGPPFQIANLSETTVKEIDSLKRSNYSYIPTIGKDASLFTYNQLEQIVQYEPRRLKGIDFLHLRDKIMFILLGLQDNNKNITILPFSIRRCATTIREYVRRYSKQSLENELKKSNEELRTITMGIVTICHLLLHKIRMAVSD